MSVYFTYRRIFAYCLALLLVSENAQAKDVMPVFNIANEDTKNWPPSFFKVRITFKHFTPRGGRVLLLMGYIGLCDPRGDGSSSVLVINRVSILAMFFRNRSWFLHSGLELSNVFLEEATFSSSSIKMSTKGLHKLCLEQLCYPQWP